MNYELVIFDFDGTLADTFPWAVGMLDQAAEKYGFRRVEAHELEQLRTMEGHAILKHVGVPLWKVPRIARYFRGAMAENIEQIPLFAGVPALLTRLRERGAVVAVVTSNSASNVQAVLGPDICDLVCHFECGVSLFGKAARLKRVLRKSGAAPESTIYIGDEIRDVDAARQVGIASGVVSWGCNTIKALADCDPEEVFQSVGDILDRIRPAHCP